MDVSELLLIRVELLCAVKHVVCVCGMWVQQENATAATQKVKEGVSSFLGGISKALVIAPDDDYQLAQIVGGEAVVFDRYKVCMTLGLRS